MGKKGKKQATEIGLKASKSHTSKPRLGDDHSSSGSSEEELVKRKSEHVVEEVKKPKVKKGKPEPEVDPGPGPGVEGVGELAMAEIIKMREEAAAALAEKLEELGGEAEEPKKKKPPKPKKGKKQKITSEMAEKMRKEAEEEAARIIEEERQRIEAEKRAALDKERKETAEQIIRSEQLEKSRILYEEITHFNKKLNRKEKSMIDWKLYIGCGELPNASICDHMSTYLHLWEKVIEETTIEDASKRTYDVMKLTNDLEDLVDIFDDEHPRTMGNWKWVLQLFRDHQQQSLEVATYRVLRNVNKNMRRIDLTTSDFDFRDDYVRLSIWLRVQLPTPLPNPRRPSKY